MQKVTPDEILETVQMYSDENIPFKFLINNHTTTIKCGAGDYYSTGNMIPMNELNFVRRVKDYVLKNNMHHRIKNNFRKNTDGTYNHDRVKYFDYKMPKKSVMFQGQHLYEIDINAAYWDTAHKLGIISDELFQKGFTMQKNTRLASLGSLAKKTIVWERDENGKETIETIHKDTEHLWFKICEKLTNTMYKAAQRAGDNFVFYWVDGIYVNSLSAVYRVCEAFDEDKYQYKIRKINWIKFDLPNKKLIVDDNINDKPRPFPLTTPKFKKYRRKINARTKKHKIKKR